MKISFNTKEESNAEQRAAFLRLSHSDRFYSWLNLMYHTKQLIPQEPPENNNFIVEINK